MLSMTKKTGYGLIALTHLAKLPEGGLASAREVAEAYSVPQALLMNVLKELSATGYVKSTRGVNGGYALAKPLKQITFMSLMETLEGPMKLTQCVSGDVGDDETDVCDLMAQCPIADPVHRVQRKIHDCLSQLTLADILVQSSDDVKTLSLGRSKDTT